VYSNADKVDNNPYMAEAVKQELQIHRSLQHDNIVSVIDVVQTANNYYIIMEFCQNGNLRNVRSSI
jgi:serine/threonine protein kinase